MHYPPYCSEFNPIEPNTLFFEPICPKPLGFLFGFNPNNE